MENFSPTRGRFVNTYVYKWKVESTSFDMLFVIQVVAKDNDGNVVRSGSLSGLTMQNNTSKPPEVKMDSISGCEWSEVTALAKPVEVPFHRVYPGYNFLPMG